jgi:hypothetical protein
MKRDSLGQLAGGSSGPLSAVGWTRPVANSMLKYGGGAALDLRVRKMSADSWGQLILGRDGPLGRPQSQPHLQLFSKHKP